MKKLLALLLAMSIVISLFTACAASETDDTSDSPSTTDGSNTDTSDEQTTSAPSESETTSVEVSTTHDPNEPYVVEASKLSKHANGWFQLLENNTDGVYFNLWTNDLPVDDSWSVRYSTTSSDDFTLIRDGKAITTVDCQILKYANTEYFLVCDPWLLGEYAPLQAGDVLIVQGNFVNYDTGWGIHIDTTYITLKGIGTAVFSTTAPDAN